MKPRSHPDSQFRRPECVHDWDFVGGIQCWNDKGGREPGYFCARPAYQCTKCGMSDYGQSKVADDHCSKCSGNRN